MSFVYHDTPLIFIGATFREKLVSHHRAVNQVPTYEACQLQTVELAKESHFIDRWQTEDVKLPKTAGHWSVSNRSAAFSL